MDSLRLLDTKELPVRKPEDLVVSQAQNCAYSNCLTIIVCSSYANSLAMFSVSVDTVDFNGGLSAFTPIKQTPIQQKRTQQREQVIANSQRPRQCSIVTTKAEPVRKPSGKNQINSLLVMNTSFRKSVLADNESIDFDINSFLGNGEKSKSDLSIISEVIFYYSVDKDGSWEYCVNNK